MLEDRYWFKMFSIILCSFLMILCGYGLFKSYSRGAWLAGIVTGHFKTSQPGSNQNRPL